jgi:hypothetical protein
MKISDDWIPVSLYGDDEGTQSLAHTNMHAVLNHQYATLIGKIDEVHCRLDLLLDRLDEEKAERG